MKEILLNEYMNFGYMVSGIGYFVVMVALSFLFGIYILIPKIIEAVAKVGKKQSLKEELVGLTGEESAAIAATIALVLNEQHDIESGTITIKKVSKRYSPWSSKIYSMNNYRKN